MPEAESNDSAYLHTLCSILTHMIVLTNLFMLMATNFMLIYLRCLHRVQNYSFCQRTPFYAFAFAYYTYTWSRSNITWLLISCHISKQNSASQFATLDPSWCHQLMKILKQITLLSLPIKLI